MNNVHNRSPFLGCTEPWGRDLFAPPRVLAVVSAGHRDGAEQLSVLMNKNPGEAVRTAFANLSPDGTAKILFVVLASPASLDAGQTWWTCCTPTPYPRGVVVAERTS
jgi:hypothetical protein